MSSPDETGDRKALVDHESALIVNLHAVSPGIAMLMAY